MQMAIFIKENEEMTKLMVKAYINILMELNMKGKQFFINKSTLK